MENVKLNRKKLMQDKLLALSKKAMEIPNIDDLLNDFKGDKDKVIAVLFEMNILNQAYLKEVLTMQAMIYEYLNRDELKFEEIYHSSLEVIVKHRAKLRAELVSKVLR